MKKGKVPANDERVMVRFFSPAWPQLFIVLPSTCCIVNARVGDSVAS